MENEIKTFFSKNDFFAEISKLANYCDEDVVKEVYYAMVRVMSRQLRERGKVNLPDWGKFELKYHAPRRFKALSGKIEQLGMKRLVKFVPDYKVKEYFKRM